MNKSRAIHELLCRARLNGDISPSTVDYPLDSFFLEEPSEDCTNLLQSFNRN